MSYEVIFAGNPLHNYMDIHNIERTILPTRENSSKSIPSVNGSYYLSHRYGEKEISLDCKIKGENLEDYMEKLTTISYLLDVDSPKKMILSDAPDRYLLVVPDGDFTVEKIGWIAKFTLKFKCFTPYEFARVPKNTIKNSMVKIEGSWLADFEHSNDVEEGEIDDGYAGDEVPIGEGEDNEINYGSDEFDTGFMEDFSEDYTPPIEDGFVEELSFEKVVLQQENHSREYKNGFDDIDYKIEPDINDKEYDYESIQANSILLEPKEISALADDVTQDDTTEDTSADTSLMLKSHQHILNFYNTGSVSTYPVIIANFEDRANFFSCTNHKGRTVLIGSIPTLELARLSDSEEVILNDTCTSLVDWAIPGNVLDDGRTITGNLGINPNGYAITCTNYGSDSDNWHGGAGRKNLTRKVTDFRVEVEMEHESSGELGSVSNSTGTDSAWYKVTGASSINHRKGRGKSYTLIQKIPKGKKLKISEIKNKWGKCTYNGKTGYVYMSYLTKTTAPSTTGSDSSSSTTYKTNIKINIRKGRGTKYSIVGKIPKGKLVKVSSIKNGWGYVSYNGKKGYVYMKNLKKTSSTSSSSYNVSMMADEYTTDVVTKEDRKGRIEVYGFDTTGKKLWKMVMRDSSDYFEYSQPEIFIGGSLVIDDGKATPVAKRKTVTEDNKSTTYKIDSGSYGDWNSFEGKFTIERVTVDGKQKWTCKVEKFENGQVVRTLSETFASDSYPTEDLASIVVWIGQYKNVIAVDTQNVCNIKVTDLASTTSTEEEVIEPIFKAGDELMVDFDEQTVTLNGIDFLEQLDIGSEFFDVPVGMSEVLCQSDTEEMYVMADYRERWL